ncbi:hypothetical protein Fmac_006555 [Flemingia macrophylla]|uniref:Uncharacterized protein n=1 Tax=Flemingia macrophylla TaxID=520843 RepID=A0ABD1NAZ4_9FABA
MPCEILFCFFLTLLYLCKYMLDWICRSDFETVMISIVNDILCIKGSEDRSS